MTKSRDLGNLAQTVAVNLPTSLGTAGQSLVVNSGANGLEFGAASGGGVTVYTGLSGTDGTPANATYLLNASSPSAGDLAYVTANTSLYQNNGNGWYRIAVINTTPTISSVADASSNTTPFALVGGTNTVVTVTASDADEGTDLTYSHSVTSGSLNGTTVTQGTGANENVFTITPHASNATTFSITFTVSDSINAATSVAAFTLEFSIADSHFTSLLMATDGSAGANSTITYDTGSTTGNSLTVAGDTHAGTFSPYRSGGYSTYFDGNDYLSISHSTDLDLGTGSFTIEGWWRFDDTSNQNLVSKYAANAGFVVQYQSGNLRLVLGLGSSDAVYSFSWTPVAGTWYHVCILRDGTDGKAFINGTQIGSTTTVTTSNVGTTGTLQIGLTHTVSEYTRGYASDVRIVKGTAITPASGGPTERLTAVTNTKLLTCHLPYFADGSSSGHSITTSGDPETKPFGPYDYTEYSESTNGGSVYFDGNGDYLGVGSAIVPTAYDTDYTVEMWIYPTTTGSREDIFNQYAASASGRMAININTDATISFFQNGLSPAETKSSAISANNWYHLAFVNSSGTRSFYVNGSLIGTATGTASMYSGNTEIGRLGDVGSNYFTGYITDVRVVNGTAVYSGAFIPPSGPLTTTGGTYPSTTNVDTSITASNTSLLLSGTDAHVIDKSQNTNLKLVNNAVAVTSASSPTPPNNTNISLQNSVFLDGSGDCVSITPGYDDPIFNFGTHDWTIEVWAYFKNLTGTRTFLSFLRAGTNEAVPHFYTDGGAIKYYVTGIDRISSASNALTLNTWHHVACSRNGNNHKLYVDGYQVGSTWSVAQTYVQGRPVLGDYHSSLNTLSNSTITLHGYAQDFRITKGLARYTAADESSNIPSSPLKG